MESEIGEFAGLVQQGIDAWTRAGELLVRLISREPSIISKIRKAHPHITVQMLHAFERIGRQQLYAPLLANTTLAARSMIELPYKDQVRYFNEPIEVITSTRPKVKTAKKRFDELSRDEVRMVFGKGEVHDLDQQLIRFKEIESIEIQKETPRPKFVDYKTVEVGYYVITLDSDGEPKIARAPASMPAATSIRLIPFPGGEKAAVVLFYRTPRS